MSPNVTILRFTPFFIRDILLPRASNDEAPLNLSTNSRGETRKQLKIAKAAKSKNTFVMLKIKRSHSVQNAQKRRRRENGRRALKEARIKVFCVLIPLLKHDNNPQLDSFVSSMRALHLFVEISQQSINGSFCVLN